MLTVGIDCRWIFRESSGIGVYTRELIRALAEGDREHRYVLIFDSDERLHATMSDPALAAASNLEAVPARWSLFSIGNQLRMPDYLRRLGLDVFHSPNYLFPLLAGGRRIPCVVTVHDVIPLLFPRHAPRSRKSRLLPLYRRLMIEVGRRADMILTDSDASRADVIRELRIPESRRDRVRRIYCGVSSRFAAGPLGNCFPRRADLRTVLYVGRSDPYKNCAGLLEAMARLRSRLSVPVRLVMAGSPDSRYPELPALIRTLKLEDAVERRYLSDGDLVAAYQSADVLALPSWYEGFGLPVVEAMRCGTPVVCSNRGALPEVAGDAALQVNPEDLDGLTGALHRVLTDSSLARDLATRGLRQSQRFTWQQTADATLDAYRAAAAARRRV